jgi:uncharacterized protein
VAEGEVAIIRTVSPCTGTIALSSRSRGNSVSICRPEPLLTQLTEPFWLGGAHSELRIQRCRSCESWVHPPSPRCRYCWSTQLEYQATSGYGKVISWTVNRQRWWPELSVPYVIALVELDEQPGLRLTTNLIGCPIGNLRFDMRVKVIFEPCGQCYLPLFEPAP